MNRKGEQQPNKNGGEENCNRKTKIAFRYIAYFGQITLHPKDGRMRIYFMYFSCIIHMAM